MDSNRRPCRDISSDVGRIIDDKFACAVDPAQAPTGRTIDQSPGYRKDPFSCENCVSRIICFGVGVAIRLRECGPSKFTI